MSQATTEVGSTVSDVSRRPLAMTDDGTAQKHEFTNGESRAKGLRGRNDQSGAEVSRGRTSYRRKNRWTEAESDFAERYGPWGLVAGGSDGIGEAFGRSLAGRGMNVALVARRKDVLEATARSITDDFGVETRAVVADVSAPDVISVLDSSLRGLDIGLVVYNAGAIHGAKHFLDRPLDDGLDLAALNCLGPMRLAHHFGTAMRDRGHGGMIFMSSMAALAGSAWIAAYSASKAFAIIFAEALWAELTPQGVDVLSVISGATDTPAMRASVSGFQDRPGISAPEDVAEGALDHLGTGPTFVPGEANQAGAMFLWPGSRVTASNTMSQGTAELYGFDHVPVAGADFFGD